MLRLPRIPVAIGGSVSNEFHVLADSGEDGIGVNTEAGFAANVELIDLPSSSGRRNPPQEAMAVRRYPGVRTI